MAGKPKAVVLVSGGMDSCVTAAMANLTHGLAVRLGMQLHKFIWDAAARGV